MSFEPGSSGTTLSEKYLSKLCKRSFLRFWSYPNLYRNQGWGSKDEGKELCDLLVVCGNDVLIFSDKWCEFPDTGSLQRDWARWFKRAIWGSAKQIRGAERWIREYPARIFLDRQCKIGLPIGIPSGDAARVHRIVVAHGSAERCRAQLGGSESLWLTSSIEGSAHFEPEHSVEPFVVGRVSPSELIHVVDDVSLDVLLNTLDTISDFTTYLSRKEELLQADFLVEAPGEEELLAWYLKNFDGNSHCLPLPQGSTSLQLPGGLWADYQVHAERLAQLEADKVSYAWDALIEKFSKHVLEGTQHFKTASTIGDLEVGLRIMAREPRVLRRGLAAALIGLMEKGAAHDRATRIVPPILKGDPYYAFLTLKHPAGKTREEYRIGRMNFLNAICMVVRRKFPDATDVIGIATEPLGLEHEEVSEDMVYLDARKWDNEMEKRAAESEVSLGLLQSLKRVEGRLDEYPLEQMRQAPKGRNRNSPCVCGSGRKFKHCCRLTGG